MSYETLSLERRGHVVELTLTRPELMNRVDDAAHRELIAVFRDLEVDHDARVVVFTGAGKVFSAGGDFELMLEGNASLAKRSATITDGYRMLDALLEVPMPVVAALNGDAIGLGATLALSCDAVVAHRGVRISDPHVPIGLVAGDGGCVVWPEAIGMLRAKRYLLTGDRLDAEEAHRIGVVTDLVDTAEDVLPVARGLADRIAGLPPLAVRGTKRSLNQVLQMRFREVMPVSLMHELVSMGSDDIREAIAAFRAKRDPTYTGT